MRNKPLMIRPSRYLALCLAAVLAGCGTSGTEAAPAPAAPPVATSVTPPTVVSPSPSPSPSPTFAPTLPTTMSDSGGSCVSEGECGYYVAGPSCKGVEWCKKANLVEPGFWTTAGSEDPSECRWGVSHPPKYELFDGGYATGSTRVLLRKGSIFDFSDCPVLWVWSAQAPS